MEIKKIEKNHELFEWRENKSREIQFAFKLVELWSLHDGIVYFTFFLPAFSKKIVSSSRITLHSQFYIIGSILSIHRLLCCSFFNVLLNHQQKKNGKTLNGLNTVIKKKNFSYETVKKYDKTKSNEN